MKINKDFLFKYKYVIVILGFFIWVGFFDFNNLINLARTSKEVKELRKESDFYKDEIKKVTKQRDDLFLDQNSLEKYARETYNMIKEDEDIFIVVEENGK